MVINHNIAALNTYRQLNANGVATQKSLQNLSSGLRINSAADDAAGLAISEKMKGQINGLDQASRNAQDGISLIQTAEGGLNETQSILQRMRELAVQSGNDTNTNSDRQQMQLEVSQLNSEITRISANTQFNTKNLLDGSMGESLFQTGNTAVLQGVQANGVGLVGGGYTLTMTTAGVDAIGTFSNSATGGMVVGDVTQAGGAQNLYGNYKLDVSGFAGGNGNLTLTGPDGSTVTQNGVNLAAAFTIGGFSFAGNTHAITSNGQIGFQLSDSAVKVDLTGVPGGGTAATMATVNNYTGQNLTVGGFQFSLKSNHGAAATTFTGNVTDNSITFQIGANANQNTTLAINNMSSTALGVNSVDVSTQVGANAAITTIDNANNMVSTERAKLGAMQNRLEHTINNLGTTSQNLTASESQITDVDMASEMMNYTKDNILSQAATAMLAQANQAPQEVLQLLK
jgi:flagellin